MNGMRATEGLGWPSDKGVTCVNERLYVVTTDKVENRER